MEQRLSLITLMVPNVTEARRFFEEGLGWTIHSAPSDNIVFFQIGGLAFAVYAHSALEKDLGRQLPTDTTGGMTIGWNGRSESEVDAAFDKAVAAGAKVVCPPEKAFWGGYTSYVEIPGGHLLEIAYNPFWELNERGDNLLP
ncbi:MAG: VOC family protein [Rhodobacteraceae bacterium]|nr:VOC family protein [Paracoccaceae bacterium]